MEEILLRLGLAALLGMIIGLERELKHKPLGLKTCIVISVASCLLTLVSIDAAMQFADASANIRTDPMRLAAQIVSGIGFLGAGVILRRGGLTVSGLTTAAVIWAAAGIGIAVGGGFYFEAIIAAVFILFSLKILPLILKFIGPKQLRAREMKLTVLVHETKNIEEVTAEMNRKKIEIKNLKIEDLPEKILQLGITVITVQNYSATDIYTMIHGIKGVKSAKVETV
ncbi:MgtC/SapB family protein [Virgibacillus sp. W0181]|uniref:MgtC/SapB family protein n=1 Tax=Virgibacillus sp. W0181 TaxID=3391581 RepID=UPI003F46BD8F